MGRKLRENIVENQKIEYYLQCIPLVTAIHAVGNPTVNLLVLDIEGGEFEVTPTLNTKLAIIMN